VGVVNTVLAAFFALLSLFALFALLTLLRAVLVAQKKGITHKCTLVYILSRESQEVF